MLNKNRFLTGFIPGLLMPLALYGILFALFGLLEQQGAASGEGLSSNFRERTLALVAIAINVLLINLYKRRRWEDAMRGVTVATGILAIVWLVRFGPGMFGQ
ncbi:MAG: hypothetical protein ACK5SQ_08565 [Chitinophagales bacterium]|jgi:hypothetical protein